MHLETTEPQQDRAKDADWSGAEDDGARRPPHHPFLDLPRLERRFLHDAQRLQQHGEGSERRWNLDHERRGLAVVLAHIAVRALDPALGVGTEQAHVAFARLAVGTVVRATHGRDHQVAPREARHPIPHPFDQAERLVSDHQEVRAGRGLAIQPLIDLGVGAIDADLQHAHQRGASRDRRHRKLHLPGTTRLFGGHRHRAHGGSQRRGHRPNSRKGAYRVASSARRGTGGMRKRPVFSRTTRWNPLSRSAAENSALVRN